MLHGPIAGPSPDLLQNAAIRALTDLSPVEAATETPGRLRQRARRKVAPLRWHMKRYHLAERIQLWVRNVVYGQSIGSIANELQLDEEREAHGEVPDEWIKRQIHGITGILGAKRRSGRPRKGGVLRVWKSIGK